MSGSGMFWHNVGTTLSPLDQLLEDPGSAPLASVLSESDVLTELKAMNKRLLEYFVRPESLVGMIDLITTEPPGDLPLQAQYKLPTVAAEVLTGDHSLMERITGDRDLLGRLFHFFRDRPAPINPLLASYVTRVLAEIITRKTEQNWYSYQLNLIQIMGYLQAETEVLSWLLNHLDASPVCDYLHKLLLNVEGPDSRASLYDWLVTKESLFLRMMDKMNRHELEDAHLNLARLVGDLLLSLQDDATNPSLMAQDRTDCDPFYVALKSTETVTHLLDTLFNYDAICESSMVNGLDLTLSLLGITRRNPRKPLRNDALDEEGNDEILVPEDVKAKLLSKMPTLLSLLKSPVDPNPLPTTVGLLTEPVGLGRLAISKFIAHLFTLSDETLNAGIIQGKVLDQLLDLFWANPWNSFLHRNVAKILEVIAMGAQKSPDSAAHVMNNTGFLSKIVDVFNDKELKVGCRGHLARVAAIWGEVARVDLEGTPNVLKDLFSQWEQRDKESYTKWDLFYSDTLQHYFAKEKVLLAGVHPPQSDGISSSHSLPYSEESESSASCTSGPLGGGGGSLPWMNNLSHNVMTDFAHVQDSMMNMSFNNDDDGGGENDNENEEDDEGNAPPPSSKSRSLFEMFCQQKSNSFDDDDDEEVGDDEDEKKSPLNLSSPDSDSLEEDSHHHHHHGWMDAEKKINEDVNLSFNIDQEIGGPDIFSMSNNEDEDGMKSPSSAPGGMLEDPWSNMDASSGNNSSDLWSSPTLLFGSSSGGGASSGDGAAPKDDGGDWACFSQSVSTVETVQMHPPQQQQQEEGSTWADFGSAAAAFDKKDSPLVVSKVNGSENKNDNNTHALLSLDEDVTMMSSEDDLQQQFQSPAKDETVSSSASQKVSATN